MRIRIAAPVLAGALALGGLTAPAAFAANSAPTVGKIAVSSLVFGPNSTKTFTFTTTVSDDSGIKGVKMLPWPAALAAHGLEVTADMLRSDTDLPPVTCKAVSKTTSVCTHSEKINSFTDFHDNTVAGTWYTAILITGKDGGSTFKQKAAVFSFKHQATVDVNAGPEPVKKGGTLTVTGRLDRADWVTGRWAGFGKQVVRLQFRPSGGKTFTNVTSVTATSTGALRTTVKATASGTWRYYFAGTGTTAGATTAGDAVTVK